LRKRSSWGRERNRFKKWWIAVSALLLVVGGGYYAILQVAAPLKYAEEIARFAKQYNVDPVLVASLVKVESDFQDDRPGGLMNLSTETAVAIAEQMGLKDFKPQQASDPETNLMLGTWLLSQIEKGKTLGDLIKAWLQRDKHTYTSEEIKAYTVKVLMHKGTYETLRAGAFL